MTIRTVITLSVALAVCLCLATAWAGPPIKLGAQAPQTGSLAKHGIEQVKGIRLAVDEFQKKHNTTVDLRVYDDESDSQKAVSAVESGTEALRVAVARRAIKEELEKEMGNLEKTAGKWLKPYPHAAWRENVEVLLVALAVALGLVLRRRRA